MEPNKEVDLERRKGNLRGRDARLHPDLAGAVLLRQARGGDLRGALGADDPQPRPDPRGGRLGTTENRNPKRLRSSLHSPKYVEGKFRELRPEGVLRSSPSDAKIARLGD